MSLSPSRLMAGELLYRPTEPICIIYKKIDNIPIVMQRETEFVTKITNNNANTKNPLTITVLIITVTTLLLLSSPVANVVSVWAEDFFGTSGPDNIVGTDEDDNIFGRGGNDDLSGEGGDDYIEGNAGNDEINDGLGSDKVRAGSGDDTIVVEGVVSEQDEGEEDDVDKAYGGKGKDIIDGQDSAEGSFLLLYGGSDDDTITAGHGTRGKVYGDGGDDIIEVQGESNYDVWGGSGNDDIGGSSECSLDRVFGGAGNDEIFQADELTKGGSGNDIITFGDCGGVAYGDSGDDELSGGDVPVELHGGKGDDILRSFEGGELFGDNGDDALYGSEVGTTLTGGDGADSFICGGSEDTITDFNAAEGDTKTADCENFSLSNASVLIDNNDDATTGTPSTPSNETVGNFPTTEEGGPSDPSTVPSTITTTETTTGSNNNETETATATATAADEQEQE